MPEWIYLQRALGNSARQKRLQESERWYTGMRGEFVAGGSGLYSEVPRRCVQRAVAGKVARGGAVSGSNRWSGPNVEVLIESCSCFDVGRVIRRRLP